MSDKKKTPAARWRSTPRLKGLAAIGQGPRGVELRANEVTLITVAPHYGGGHRIVTGWYWYGMGQNTCGSPVATLEEAKAQATKFYKDNKDALAAQE